MFEIYLYKNVNFSSVRQIYYIFILQKRNLDIMRISFFLFLKGKQNKKRKLVKENLERRKLKKNKKRPEEEKAQKKFKKELGKLSREQSKDMTKHRFDFLNSRANRLKKNLMEAKRRKFK